MSELPPERPEESPESMLLRDVINRERVEAVIEDSQKGDEAARKRNANIMDVKSEIAVLWELRNEPDTIPEDISAINQRLLDAQARLIELEPPKTQEP